MIRRIELAAIALLIVVAALSTGEDTSGDRLWVRAGITTLEEVFRVTKKD